MATTTEVINGLDDIANRIFQARRKAKQAKENLAVQDNLLDSIPANNADLLATIAAYGDTDAFEVQCKAKLAKLTTEFVALNAATTAAVVDLASQTEF